MFAKEKTTLYIYSMKKEKKMGRKPTDPETHKKNRPLSLTDDEMDRLIEKAVAAKLNTSAYIIRELGLNGNNA